MNKLLQVKIYIYIFYFSAFLHIYIYSSGTFYSMMKKHINITNFSFFYDINYGAFTQILN
jgi:hypothetical protein